jgi:SAM-dependent methyltransferase
MNDWLPMDEQQSAFQIKEIIALLGEDAKRIVDVGCGDGRILVPLAVAGHVVIGIDVDAEAISACAHRCAQTELDATLLDGDLFDLLPLPDPVDAIVCCGQMFMLLHDVDEAVCALRLFRKSLRKGGVVILDDIPGDLWPEVAQGRWAIGVNEEESLQLVWSHNDAVFAIREGEQVDTDSWELQEGDQRVRLWTMGAMRMAAKLAGLSAPIVPVAGAILVMRAD